MELLATKKRRALAEKGHKLLTEKRDSLISHFFSLLDERKILRAEVKKAINEAYSALFKAELVMGRERVVDYARISQGDRGVKVVYDTVMGVKIPKISLDSGGEGIRYPFIGTSALLDKTLERFEVALEKIVKLAQVEDSLRRIALEIESVKRRVNALEHIIIPSLIKAEKYIELRLDEAEREDFFRRKRMKQLMARKEGG